MFSKNLILFGLLVINAVSGFFLFYFRYSNQSILLSNFDFTKHSNLITIILFVLLGAFIIINMISRAEYNKGGLVLLLICSLIGLVSLFVSLRFEDKTDKIEITSIYIFTGLYVLISLILLSLSRSKKLHIFSGIWIVVLLIGVLFSFTLYQVYYFKDDVSTYYDGTKRANAGVVLGAAVWGGNRPSPILRERINKAFEIYEKKYVPKLVLTGGGSPNEMSEGEVAKNELIKYGVDKNNLFVEDKSNSTFEQILFVRDKLYKKNRWDKIILVSDNYHLFRSSEICRFNGMNVDCISTDTPHTPEGAMNFCLKETVAVIFYWVFGIG
ncbi:MAG TPA: YdcF family protein [Ignavibacteria bacterium]